MHFLFLSDASAAEADTPTETPDTYKTLFIVVSSVLSFFVVLVTTLTVMCYVLWRKTKRPQRQLPWLHMTTLESARTRQPPQSSTEQYDPGPSPTQTDNYQSLNIPPTCQEPERPLYENSTVQVYESLCPHTKEAENSSRSDSEENVCEDHTVLPYESVNIVLRP